MSINLLVYLQSIQSRSRSIRVVMIDLDGDVLVNVGYVKHRPCRESPRRQ